MISRKHYTHCLLLMFVVTLFCSGVKAETLSTQEWIAQKDGWKELVKSGKSITIEGRVSTISGDQLRLLKCPLAFYSESKRPFKRPKQKHFNVLVTGYLKTHQGKIGFIVTRMYTAPVDLDEFESRSNRISKGKPEQWFKLSKWAENRAKFYNDKLLQGDATTAWLNGVKSERSLLKAGDAKGLFQLADKLKAAKLKERLQLEYKHTGYRYLWEKKKKQKEQNYKPFLILLKDNFLECETPFVKPDVKLYNSYKATPIKTYQESNNETRKKLHRLFYREVLLPVLLANTKDSPRMGYEVAEKIDQQIPEEKALAEQLREKEIAYRMEHVQTASRKQLLNLKQKYLDKKRPQQAEFIVEKWLAARETALRKEGPSGLLRSARLCLELKNDRKKAVQLLLEAHKKDAKTKGVAEELEKLGYRYYKEKWLTEEEYKHRKVDPIQRAMQNGTPIPGMSRDQVKKTLGAPTSKFRMLSSNAVTEIWVFGESNETRLTVHFSQSNLQNDSAKVTKVKQIQPR